MKTTKKLIQILNYIASRQPNKVVGFKKAYKLLWLIDRSAAYAARYIAKNLMKPHKKHAYQIMANELGMPHLVVSGIYMALQAICCVLFIIWPNYYTFFIELAVLITMYIAFMKKYYHLHGKKD